MKFGMFGEDVGYMSSKKDDLSEEMVAKIDKTVKDILQESEERVEKLLTDKGPELREVAKNLYWYDYLDASEMEKLFKGQTIDKEKVREWDKKEEGGQP